MLLTFLISQLIFTALANPFHKYPYIFLLDVGNEEISNTNTEQIRVTIPGGSLALKYPATADGDPIVHVRVSGVDFGTDLKANIVAGGPGYNYIVIVFMGNSPIAYDAVITIETVADNINPQNIPNDNDDNISNDSAEDMSENSESKVIYSGNKAIIESSNTVYKYSDNSPDNDYEENHNVSGSEEESQSSDVDSGVSEENGDNDKPSEDDDAADEKFEQTVRDNVNREKYAKYQAFTPRLYGGVRFYPQAALYVDGNYARPVYDPEDHNEAIHSANVDANEYKDSNNNVRPGYGLAVE